MRIIPNSSGTGGYRQAGVCLHGHVPVNERGFTLIEVMIVIVIIGIMTGVAIPSFSDWRNKQAVRSASQSLIAHLKQARVLALAENRSVSVSFTSTSYTFDADTTGSCGPCKNQAVNLGQFSGNLTVTRSNPALVPTVKTFSSRGTASSTTLYLCSSGHSKRIVLNIIGRAYECLPGDTTASCTSIYNCQ